MENEIVLDWDTIKADEVYELRLVMKGEDAESILNDSEHLSLKQVYIPKEEDLEGYKDSFPSIEGLILIDKRTDEEQYLEQLEYFEEKMQAAVIPRWMKARMNGLVNQYRKIFCS